MRGNGYDAGVGERLAIEGEALPELFLEDAFLMPLSEAERSALGDGDGEMRKDDEADFVSMLRRSEGLRRILG